MLATRLPIGITTQAGLDEAFRLSAEEQRSWILKHDPAGYNLVLIGYVFARDGDDLEAFTVRRRIQDYLVELPYDATLVWRWIARGYWLYAAEVAEGDPIETERIYRDAFFTSRIFNLLESLGWRVKTLDENRQVEYRLGSQRTKYVLQQAPEGTGQFALNPGDEVLVSQTMFEGVYETVANRRIFLRFMAPAHPATAEMVADSFATFGLARY